MSCGLCKNLPLTTVRSLDAAIEAGELSIVQLATNYGTTTKAIEGHLETCAISARSGYALLNQLLDSINRAAVQRKQEYDGCKDEIAMDQYIALVREARSTVMAMDKLKPSEELLRLIIQQVLIPFVSQCIAVNVDECNRLREDTRAYVDTSLYPKLDQAIKITLQRIAIRLKRDTSDLVPRLRKLLNIPQPQDDPLVDIPGVEEDPAVIAPPIN